MAQKKQMSESFIVLSFITLSGGLQDAYTYFARGKVFANAQTGNIVLMSANLFEGDFLTALRYLIPLGFFSGGIFLADQLNIHLKNNSKIHWRQIVLAIEIILLFLAGLFPESMNLIANAFVSFACAMQVQTFRKANGNAYASTMCIGNLRSAMDALSKYITYHNKIDLQKSFRFLRLIFIFFLGAGMGAIFVQLLHFYAIFVCCLILLVVFCLMFKEEGEIHDPLVQEQLRLEKEKQEKIQSLYQAIYDLEMGNEEDI